MKNYFQFMHSFPSKKTVHISDNFAEYHSCEYIHTKFTENCLLMYVLRCFLLAWPNIDVLRNLSSGHFMPTYCRQLIRKSDASCKISFCSSFFTDFHLTNQPLSYFLLVTWYVDHVQPNVKTNHFYVFYFI